MSPWTPPASSLHTQHALELQAHTLPTDTRAAVAARADQRGARRLPTWRIAFALFGVLLLAAAFAQVVQQGTEQAQARHRDVAARAEAMWRCNAMADVRRQALCLRLVDEPPQVGDPWPIAADLSPDRR